MAKQFYINIMESGKVHAQVKGTDLELASAIVAMSEKNERIANIFNMVASLMISNDLFQITSPELIQGPKAETNIVDILNY